MTKQMSQALGLADEYRREVRPERLSQIRSTIEELVGCWVSDQYGPKLVIPARVRQAMGVQ